MEESKDSLAPVRAARPTGAAEMAQPGSQLDTEVDIKKIVYIEKVVDNMLRSYQQNICTDASNNVKFYFILVKVLQSIQREINESIDIDIKVCTINTNIISDHVKNSMYTTFSYYHGNFPNVRVPVVNVILKNIGDTLDFKVLSGILARLKITDIYNYTQEILSNPDILNRIGDAIDTKIRIMDFSNIMYNNEKEIVYIFNFDPLIDFISKLVLKNKKKFEKLIFKYVNISYKQLTQLKKNTNHLEYSFFYTPTVLHENMLKIENVVVSHCTWESPLTGGNRTRKKCKNRRAKYKGGGWFNKPTSKLFNDKWKKIGDSPPQKAILEQTAW